MVVKKTQTKKPAPRKRSPSSNGESKSLTVNRVDPLLNELQKSNVVLNALLARSGFLKDYLTETRDIDAECGYPGTNELTVKTLKFFYDREAVATRVVQLMPEESWGVFPEVFETEDVDNETEFEAAWKSLTLELTGESKFKRKEGNSIWEYLKRVDVLSGIGFYGLLFLGLDDGKDLREPAESRENQKVLFMRAFDQSSTDITNYDTDTNSPRFGLPTLYNIEFSSPSENVGGGIGVVNTTVKVHWTRVIHIADNLDSNEVFGVPRMRPVFNRLWDLRKLYGGSAEMYWKGAFPGLSLETHPSLGGNPQIDIKGIRAQIEEYQEGLQRYLATKGISVNSLAPQVVDPSPQINIQIEAICVQLSTPKRIFLGSERGELASSQDMKTWNKRVRTRQNTYITPRIIVQFIDRLILLGVLPEPDEYHVKWPDLESSTDEEKAVVAVKKIEGLVKYVAGDVSSIMHPLDLYTKIMDMDPDEAEAILELAMEEFEGLETEEDEVGGESSTELPGEVNEPLPGVSR